MQQLLKFIKEINIFWINLFIKNKYLKISFAKLNIIFKIAKFNINSSQIKGSITFIVVKLLSVIIAQLFLLIHKCTQISTNKKSMLISLTRYQL